MKKIKILEYLLLVTLPNFAQTNAALSIDSCYAMAKRNYPLLKQMALIEQSTQYSLDNASKGHLPQINLSGQATYQSAVTKLPISLPGISIKELSKDQYKIYGEINQSLTDPLIIKQQKALIMANSDIEKDKLAIELYKLKERVNQLYFGILVIDEQIHQSKLLLIDLESTLKKIEAGISNGVSLKSQADQLYAEHLKIEQRIIEQKAARKGYCDMLALFIKQDIGEVQKLEMPRIQELNNQINRPEIRLYDTQKKSVDIQTQLLSVRYAPKLSLFIQGGYGRPTLNALSNDFGSYYIGGARFSWNISNYFTFKKEQQQQGINRYVADVQKEVFIFNTNVSLRQQNAEVEKLKALIKTDEQMIKLREKITLTAHVKLENGTINMTDYLNQLNAEDQAKQNKVLHEVQLLLASYTYQTTSGN